MPVRMIGSGSSADVDVVPLPPFHLTLRVAGRPRRDDGCPPSGALATLRTAAGSSLAAATIACPRRRRARGKECLECAHLVGWQIDPMLRLWCGVDGEDRVAEWMSPRPERTVVGARAGDVDRDAAAAGVHHVLVVDGAGALVGIVCRCDLDGAGDATVAERMSATVYAAPPATTLRVAIAAMKQLSIGCLPVIDADGRVLGLFSRAELARTGLAGELEQPKS